MTTPLGIKHGRLCSKEFDKTMKWSASYRIELDLLSSQQNLTVYQHLRS